MMNKKTRERSMRILLSSLIGSDLTVAELRSLSVALLAHQKFARGLGEAIANLVDELRYESKKPHYIEELETPIDEALTTIKKRRISKAKVISLIGLISEKAETYFSRKIKVYAVRDILTEFYDVHGKELFLDFLILLQDDLAGQDEYLKGIMKKE